MSMHKTINDNFRLPSFADGFDMSVDDLLAQLVLDNYCMVPCQD